MKPRKSDKAIAAALKAAGGMVTVAAKNLGYTRAQLWNRMQANPALQQIVEDERESLVDIAEGALKRAVLGGEAWAVCFSLKCQGKRRGYVERQEVEHVGQPAAVRVVHEGNWFGLDRLGSIGPPASNGHSAEPLPEQDRGLRPAVGQNGNGTAGGTNGSRRNGHGTNGTSGSH